MQGAFVAPDSIKKIYIAADNQYSNFHKELRKQLLSAGIELSEFPVTDSAVFNISFDETSQRVLSVSARNVPTEYEVFYTITYSINSGQNILMPNQTVTLTRNYTYDSTLVLGKAREEELLRKAIVKDLVRIVMRQISTL